MSTNLKRNDDIVLHIDSLASEGQGVGRHEGFAVFVAGALPGETVNAHIIKVTSSYAVAKLNNVPVPAPTRVVPRCSMFARCGGCSLQHMNGAAQLAFKRQKVEDAFRRLGGFSDIDVLPVLGMDDPWHYRNKGSFPLGLVNGHVQAGFFAPHSHRLVPLTDCCIERPQVMQAVTAVCRWADENGLSVYDEQTHRGLLRHIVVRVTTTNEVMAAIVVNGSTLPHAQKLVDTLKSDVTGLKSVIMNVNTQRTNVIFGRKFSVLWGAQQLADRICDLTFDVSAASFLQVNPVQTETLYGTAANALALCGTETVVDAYCGIGTISLILARTAKEVIGIETVSAAVEDAKRNAAHNGITNARFICADSGKALLELTGNGVHIDALCVDPPRKGCDETFLNAVCQSGVPRMVYVSCNPATLARDCKYLAAHGFVIQSVQPVDMFPQTPHVETVVLLSREDR